MSVVRRLLGRARLREARGRLTKNPCPSNYALLAQEYALVEEPREALRVCEEGLALFPANAELLRMADRVRKQQREQRIAQLRAELRDGGRPALYRELSELLLEAGLVARAEECIGEWLALEPVGEAQLALARVRVERFLADRGRDAGQRALETLSQAQAGLPRDARVWRLELRLLAAIGAWKDARRCVARLLELQPGDPTLEARFRAYEPLAKGAPDIDQALREVERSGRLVDERGEAERDPEGSLDVRPLLRRLAAERDVHAALYLRGGTALVQGPKGATAERTARAVREVAQGARSTARKLGLGRVFDVRLEGSFGSLAVALGELDAGALWVHGELSRAHETALMDLAGSNASTGEGKQ